MRQAFITADCRNEIKSFARSRPIITEKIESFILFRESHADSEGFNKKDKYFAPTSPLKGYRHVHIHHGKCILIYQTNAQGVYLYALCDHNKQDSEGLLARRLKSYTASDFSPFYVKVEPVVDDAVSALVEKIRNDVFELAASDPDIIQQGLRGKGILIDFLSSRAPTDEIMAAFGGAEKFNAFLRKTLSDYGIREGIRDWMNIIKEAYRLW